MLAGMGKTPASFAKKNLCFGTNRHLGEGRFQVLDKGVKGRMGKIEVHGSPRIATRRVALFWQEGGASGVGHRQKVVEREIGLHDFDPSVDGTRIEVGGGAGDVKRAELVLDERHVVGHLFVKSPRKCSILVHSVTCEADLLATLTHEA